MMLSVAEAATLLNLSERAVRARLARGDLPGRKDGSRWVIPSWALPLPEAQHRALQARADELRATLDSVLPSRGSRLRDSRRRSVLDLDAFRAVRRVAATVRGLDDKVLPRQAAILVLIEDSIVALAEAWHQYSPTVRLAALTRARGALGRAVGLALVDAGDPPPGPILDLVETMEQDVLPLLAGLFRSAERAARRRNP